MVQNHRNPRGSDTMRLTRAWARPSSVVYVRRGSRSAAALDAISATSSEP